MRSRYSAYALGLASFVTATWHPQTRQIDIDIDRNVMWTRLRVLSTERGDKDDATGVVVFRAYYRHFNDGQIRGVHEESSYFVRDPQGMWLYHHEQ